MQFHSSDFIDKVHVPAVVRGSVCLQIIRCNVNCLTRREHSTITMTAIAKKACFVVNAFVHYVCFFFWSSDEKWLQASMAMQK
jgi:hypothetical protein